MQKNSFRLCQKNDRPNHKNACKDAQLEKALTRIAEIARQAYLNFRETTWDIPVVRIDQVPDGLEIHWADKTKSSSHFSNFPAHMATSQNVREAALVAMHCDEPQAHLHGLIKALTEVFLRLISQKVTISREGAGTNANWPNYRHAILRIRSEKTKTQWIIDITGAQYGIRRALWKWRDYENMHMAVVARVYELGYFKYLLDKASKIQGMDGLSYRVGMLAAGNLDQAITKWAVGHKKIAEIIDLDEEAYQVDKASLLESMDTAVRSFVAANNFNAQFREAKAYDRKCPGKSANEIIMIAKTYCE
ncbi:hypothetical protein COCCADRAFT_32403 [Bipolaris zeicola 26-R-13]|uniref:Uncharacterized protein n=1 Tax=Cochliobolus carbonum (strain 26-R-13) TaxID=930089 RepID=W6YLR6_COCC2|nr:uncharacterized protein COCCADRAFT_32403 [Bipolaris zeicola 26-R-13]EUC38463.1 hypothetical protein COCCADRAFT_32403 [Bipolaris zeicola 26-R-13]